MRPFPTSTARRPLALALSALALAGVTAAAGAARADAASVTLSGAVPRSYDVAVTWTPSSRVLAGSSTIAFTNAGSTPLRRVWARLWANGIAPTNTTDCTKARETVTRVTGGAVGEYRTGCSAVAIDLAQPVAPGQQGTVTLGFQMTTPTDSDILGRIQGVDTFGNALPVLAVQDDRGLHIEPYPSDGEAAYTLAADWRTRVTVPSDEQVAMTGTETSATSGATTTYSSTAHVRDVAFAAGQLTTQSATVDGVQLRVVSGDKGKSALAGALANLKSAFSTYEDWYGQSNFNLSKLDVFVTTNIDFGGQEYPGFLISEPDVGTIAHETAHQWFYGLVGANQYTDPWLDESFATWNEQQFNKDYTHCDTSDPLDGSTHGLATGMDYWTDHPKQYDDVIYRGGWCALTRLQQDIGTSRFLTVLRDEVTDYDDGVVRTSDFLDEVRRVAPDYDVDAWARLVGLE